MTAFNRIASGLDVSQIVAQIDANPSLFNRHTIRKTAPGTPHSGVSDIWLRYRDVAPFEATGDFRGFNDEHTAIFYPAWHEIPAIHNLTFDIMRALRATRLGGVLITRVPPGHTIDRHVDRGWHVETYRKVYVALKAPLGATFHTDGETYQPVVGDVVEFDNRLPHWVINASDEDRLTAIICVETEAFNCTA